MAITINAKGTSTSSFIVGKDGTTITQGGVISPPAATDLKIDLDVDQNLVIDAGLSGPSLITTTDDKDLHINPAVGGGQYLVLVGSRWPVVDGTANQVLKTNGSGVLSWTSTGSGSVTDASVVTANGFSGSVATSTSTPAITLSTTVTGVIKGNGTALSAAASGDITTALGYTPVDKAGDTMTGSLTAPSFIPSSSTVPTNGLYLPAANSVGISTNTTQRVSINSTGNVTINAPSNGTALRAYGYAASAGDSALAMAVDDLTSTHNPYLGFFRDGSLNGYTGVVGTASGLINGSGVGDYAMSAQTGNLLFSSTAGASFQLKIAATTGNVISRNNALVCSFDGDVGSNGSTAGNIVARRSTTQGAYYFGDADTRYLYGDSATFSFGPAFTQLRPASDNGADLGGGENRWGVVYAVTGTINTSDETTKTEIEALNTAELNVAQAIKGLIKKFKYIDAVALKGSANARIHVGVIAQDVRAAFIAGGLDPHRYGMFCEDKWYEIPGVPSDPMQAEITAETPGAVQITRLGVRYEELLAFVIAAL